MPKYGKKSFKKSNKKYNRKSGYKRKSSYKRRTSSSKSVFRPRRTTVPNKVMSVKGLERGTYSTYKKLAKATMSDKMLSAANPFQLQFYNDSGSLLNQDLAEMLTQNSGTFVTIMDVNTINGIITSANIATSNAAGGTGPPIDSSKQEIWVEDIKFELLMTNHSGLPVRITLYDVHTKRDHSTSIKDLWQTGLNNLAMTGSGSMQTSDYGSYPEISPQFKEYIGTDAKRVFYMASGGTHSHTGTIQYHKKLNRSVIGTGLNNFAGWTKQVFVTAVPFPAHFGDSESVPQARFVAAPPFRIDYAWRQVVKYRTVGIGRTSYYEFVDGYK